MPNTRRSYRSTAGPAPGNAAPPSAGTQDREFAGATALAGQANVLAGQRDPDQATMLQTLIEGRC
ncbi:hypothetical protein PJP10_01935 [Mycobacterium kansasii]